MIIKILDDQERPICVYGQGRWVGNVSPQIVSEAIEIMIIAMRNRSEQFFHDLVQKLPIEGPSGP